MSYTDNSNENRKETARQIYNKKLTHNLSEKIKIKSHLNREYQKIVGVERINTMFGKPLLQFNRACLEE